MQEEMKKVNILFIIAILFILLGTALQIDRLIKENEKQQKIIDNQAERLIKCESENESLWDNYYMNASEYEGEYYE